DKELVIDPAFFNALQRFSPDINRVEIQLKGGRSHNEMTRFQYDVTLRIGSRTEGRSCEIDSFNWQDNKINAAGIRSLLEEEKPELLSIRRVLNARIAADVKAVELLETDDGLETASDLRQALKHLSDEAVDPEDLWILENQLPYDVEINGNNSHLDQYDALFRRRGSGLTCGLESAPLNGVKPWSQYANNPMKVKFSLQIEPQLRAFLKECLPEHLIPATFIFLDTLPRTRTGKVDRKSLPQPESQRSQYGVQYIAPETEMELLIAEVWQKLLRVDRVGINDNFFELGGHSLLATQVINKLRQSYSVELPLRTIFESPTIAGLAKQVELAQKQGEDDADKMAQIIQKIKNLSADEVAAEMKALQQVSRPS
ncbi:MAG TPA: phosphopantetheine-binding protein, partial [Pyrinomonadaceae bacterium]|nr:phosphopantetheine-binding protein [Pyrinomonadaceae bacterium]